MRIVNVGAMPGSDAFLIITDKKTALVDSGFSFCADKMIENIKRELNGKDLDYILLTHSHYDHASGSAYCSEHWPNVKCVCGEYASKIFAKDSAISLMKEMNLSAAKENGVDTFVDKLDSLKVDIAVKEGDSISLGDYTLQVVDAPGHTKCSIAFYIPENKMLISSETLGVYVNENLVDPCYLVG